MRIEDFDYDLPGERIAQEPAERREASRLMVVERDGAGIAETTFARLADFLRPGDLLVLNDTRVTPARLHARKPTGGRVDLLLLDDGAADAPDTRVAMLSTSKGLGPGARLAIPPDLEAVVIEAPAGGRARLRFSLRHDGASLTEAILRHGVMPLPPYIRRDPGDARAARDRERYQTVYATSEGAVAAPTAGLHFTREMLETLQQGGVGVAWLTLHVGPGTFLPVRAATVEDHHVEPERYVLPAAAAGAVAACRRRRGRVVAVGTTVTRVLEAGADGDGGVRPGAGWCDLYIRPGHAFRVVDALLTNLHLPRSSLLILVAAFAGRERILAAYREAVRRDFRFYSYGDAMLIA